MLLILFSTDCLQLFISLQPALSNYLEQLSDLMTSLALELICLLDVLSFAKRLDHLLC